jgi:hypothetical protein
VVLNEAVSVSCGKKGTKPAVLDKKIKGLSDYSHFLVKFLSGRRQATEPPKSTENRIVVSLETMA